MEVDAEPSAERRDQVVAEFVSFTGASADDALRTLVAANWNLELAVGLFFEESEGLPADNRPDVEVVEKEESVSPVPVVDEPPETHDEINLSSSSDDEAIPKKKSASVSGPEKASTMSGKRFATLSDLNKDESARQDSGGESDGSDPGDRHPHQQAFYVGGGENSGQEVLGPDSRDVADRLFRSARDHGATPVDATELQADSQRDGRFYGSGYRLGDSVIASERVGAAAAAAQKAASAQPDVVTCKLILWKNGFSVDDGPLRTHDDEESKKFIASIRSNRIPDELARAHPHRQIDLQMLNHTDREYTRPPLKPFSGAGQRLGGIVPGMAPVAAAAAVASAAPPSAAAASSPSAVTVDESQPTTRVQIRLADGRRLMGHFNHTHTVAHVRAFICSQDASAASREFVLVSGFPSREIADEQQTLVDAQLLNSVVTQKPKTVGV